MTNAASLSKHWTWLLIVVLLFQFVGGCDRNDAGHSKSWIYLTGHAILNRNVSSSNYSMILEAARAGSLQALGTNRPSELTKAITMVVPWDDYALWVRTNNPGGHLSVVFLKHHRPRITGLCIFEKLPGTDVLPGSIWFLVAKNAYLFDNPMQSP